MATIVGWLKSTEGGLRWAGNFGRFAGIVLAAWLLSLILGALAERAMNRAMRTSRRMSSLMRDFISKSIRRIVLVIGVVVALSALEVEIGPLLAVIAGAGFVIAFALQESLSNLASGIMILIYRPFDVGDSVDVAGVSGSVKSMNLVSTTIATFDNKVVIVPNNSVWGGVITNATGSKTRRVDLVFGIGYDSDVGTSQSILERIVADHPAVLDRPEPNIKLHELADSSVNFICRPWVKTEDYWTVYWEVTRSVKEEFEKAGISIPYPQRDIHVHHTTPKGEPPVTEISPAAGEHLVS